MPKAVAFQNITVTAGGGTTTILSTSQIQKVVLSSSGSITMAGNYILTHDGAWAEGSELDVLWTVHAAIGGGDIILFGYTLTAAQAAAGNLEGTAYAKSGSVVFTPKLTTGSGQVGTADYTNASVTTAKMANLTAGNILIGNASDRPTALDISADAAIPIGQGGGVVAANVITGDVDVIKTGASSIQAGVIEDSMVDNAAGIQVKKLQAMADGEIIVGNTGSGNIATVAASSGDVLVSSTGAMTVQAGVITPEKGTTNLIKQALPVFINFELQNGEGKYSVTMGENFELLDVWCNLDSDAAHNIQIDMNINGVAVTGGVINFTAGDPKNTNNQGTAITANNTGAAGDVVNFILTVDPTETSSGSVSLIYKKTS